MKECVKCNTKKDVTEFHKNGKGKSGLSSYCKVCQRTYKKKHYQDNKQKYIDTTNKNRQWFIDYKKTLKCNRCGFAHPAALDFHHIDPNTKDFNMARVSKGNKDKIIAEIAKCEVLCANCHRIEHAKHYD